MTSLRRTAMIWLTALLTIVGALAFVISYELSRREAADFLDSQLRQVALNAGEGLGDASAPPAKHDPEDDFFMMIWLASGEAVLTSPNGAALPRQSKPGFATIRSGGEDWRVYLASDGRRSVQVAQRTSVREEMAQAAAIEAGAPILVIIPLSWLVIGWALGRVLDQLTKLAGQIATRGVNSREPIPVSQVPGEVRPLVEGMNVLTIRLQRALEQQKRFVSDAAHELRTPLAGMQIQLDNLEANTNGDPSFYVSKLRSGVNRASTLLQQLLRLARSEEATFEVRREIIDLSELITQCVADFVPFAVAKGVDLGIVQREMALVCGDPADFKLLFDNLVDNAVRYTPAGGSVDVSVHRNGEAVAVDVLDTGCGVADVEIPRLFDRFFRAAPIDVDGSGLGLSIVAAVAERHGLTIAIENRKERTGLRVRVSTPLGSRSLINLDAATQC